MGTTCVCKTNLLITPPRFRSFQPDYRVSFEVTRSLHTWVFSYVLTRYSRKLYGGYVVNLLALTDTQSDYIAG